MWSRDAIKQKCIVVKIAIVASDSCDQSPTTSALEPVIDAIIASINLPFVVDRVAILSFDTAIPTKQGSIYFTYAYLSLSPRGRQTPSPYLMKRTLRYAANSRSSKGTSTAALTGLSTSIPSQTYPRLLITSGSQFRSSMTWMKPSASSSTVLVLHSSLAPTAPTTSSPKATSVFLSSRRFGPSTRRYHRIMNSLARSGNSLHVRTLEN